MNFTYLTSTVCCCFRSKQKVKTLHANLNLNFTRKNIDFIDHEDADDENEDHVRKCGINSIWCKKCENQTEFEKYEYYEICKNCDCQEKKEVEENTYQKNNQKFKDEDYEQNNDLNEDQNNEEEEDEEDEEELSEIEIEKDENDETYETFDDEYMNKKDN
jgi:flagellar motor protein MotB